MIEAIQRLKSIGNHIVIVVVERRTKELNSANSWQLWLNVAFLTDL